MFRGLTFLGHSVVQFANRHIKNLTMESLYKIKSLAMKFKNIVVAHDLTKKQR